jgi:hypothetical protein
MKVTGSGGHYLSGVRVLSALGLDHLAACNHAAELNLHDRLFEFGGSGDILLRGADYPASLNPSICATISSTHAAKAQRRLKIEESRK